MTIICYPLGAVTQMCARRWPLRSGFWAETVFSGARARWLPTTFPFCPSRWGLGVVEEGDLRGPVQGPRVHSAAPFRGPFSFYALRVRDSPSRGFKSQAWQGAGVWTGILKSLLTRACAHFAAGPARHCTSGLHSCAARPRAKGFCSSGFLGGVSPRGIRLRATGPPAIDPVESSLGPQTQGTWDPYAVNGTQSTCPQTHSWPRSPPRPRRKYITRAASVRAQGEPSRVGFGPSWAPGKY